MIVRATSRALAIEQLGDVTLATFTVRTILDQETTAAVGQQLSSLVRDEGCKRLVINFGNLERLTTYLVGKIVLVHQQAQAAGGRLALCCIKPGVGEVFSILRLNRVLNIYSDEQEALQSF